jgi:hypothetical protein
MDEFPDLNEPEFRATITNFIEKTAGTCMLMFISEPQFIFDCEEI